jgi:small subunit ribosomal protein S3e
MSQKTQIKQINKKKKFVADGVFHAELHQFLSRALAAAGYAGIEIRVTPVKTEIRIKATKINEVIGAEGLKIRELTSLVQKRFNYSKDAVELLVDKIQRKGICAAAQAESLKFKLLSGIPVRMGANSIIKGVLKDGAKGCEIIISGKLRQQRAKSMKYKQGYLISTGQPRLDYMDEAVRHVFFKQGIMGIKIRIMLDHDPTGRFGIKAPFPDRVEIREPKNDNEEEERRGGNQAQAQQPAQGETQQ